jgi:hypothetical protein
VEHSLFLGGEVVDLRGRVSNSAKEKVISATGRVLVMDKT